MDYITPPSSYERFYVARNDRYKLMEFRPVGDSGLKISPITIGTWQNFSDLETRESVRNLYLTAFDNGIFSFDFGNNYGRPPGSAEALFGSFVTNELRPYRNELVISTKAGYDMWPGPNGSGGSLKYLISSLDESLKRMHLDYVDIFYSHCYDATTPLHETAEALDFARRSGRCLYVGISSYAPFAAKNITSELLKRGTSVIINQSHYNMFTRWPEENIFALSAETGTGFAAFAPLAQGLLSEKYLLGAPQGRGAGSRTSVCCTDLGRVAVALRRLESVAVRRGQSISQLALSWVLRHSIVCTAVVGVRTSDQIKMALKLDLHFDKEEETEISDACAGIDVDLWRPLVIK